MITYRIKSKFKFIEHLNTPNFNSPCLEYNSLIHCQPVIYNKEFLANEVTKEAVRKRRRLNCWVKIH